MDNVFLIGFKLMFGVMAAIAVMLMIVGIAASIFGDRDKTDSPDKRSNMRLLIDHETGLQYLGAPGGGITPRLDRDGKHMREDKQ